MLAKSTSKSLSNQQTAKCGFFIGKRNMADTKISGLSANSTLNGTELFELVQSGSNVKALLSAIKTYIINGYLTATTAASTYQTQSGMSNYATTTSLTNGLLANLTPTINTQTGTAYTVGTVTTDNDGKTYLRMTNNASANTVTVTTALTKPVSISQRGAGVTTLVAGSGVTLNGTLAFTAQHQTKTVIPIGSGVFDVVG